MNHERANDDARRRRNIEQRAARVGIEPEQWVQEAKEVFAVKGARKRRKMDQKRRVAARKGGR